MKTTTVRRLTKFTLISLVTLNSAMADLASRERIRRENLIQEAEQHLYTGRDAYARGDFQTAVDEYRSALAKTPAGGAAASRRKAITEHLSDGSVQLSQQYRKNGKYDEARRMLEDVLIADPTNQAALRQLDYLDDPIRTNPALTYDHTKNVDKVRRLLYMGEGFYNLGQFDKAEIEFNKVLKIDSYNKAARRWLERCHNIRADYYRAAYDETRARLLSEVDKAWELAVSSELEEVVIAPIQREGSNNNRGAYITEKLRRIIIPSVDFEDTPVEEAVAFLRQRSRELDLLESDPTRKGVNFIVRAGGSSGGGISGDLLGEEVGSGGEPRSARISELKLTNVPLVEVLQFICDGSGLRYRVDEFAVTLLPIDDPDVADQISRTWSVTPTFLADLGGGVPSSGGGDDDPFGGGGDDSPSPFATANVQELLQQSGVEFNSGATASFIPATSTLIVRNSINNLDLVDAIVQEINGRTPKQIKILTKFVEISQDNTEELGFDWSLGTTGNDVQLRGGVTGNGRDFDSTFGTNPVTSGLRSGDTSILGNSIDNLLNSTSVSSAFNSAPGILSLGGVFDGGSLEVLLRGLSQKRGTDVMNAPSLVARSGESAKIEIIRELIYPTEYEPPEVPQRVQSTGIFPVTPATPTAFDVRNTGVTLEISPTIGSDNDYVIDLQFAPEIVEFEGFVNYGSPILGSTTNTEGETEPLVITENRIEMPIFSTRRVSTALTLYDGFSVAVGGLLREDVQTVEDKVPILGDIPLIGRLFQSNGENRLKSNLIIFVTAQVIDATGKPIRGGATSSDSALDEILGDNLLPDPI